ncbi:hypothetical protein B0A48_08740 [Cryoendolithus antarcticus]|uniref:BTB domain-containing protein n=1 Tax=Cryoendolithus antarcticus TaxID=1507870 RepID=A0A1V8T4R4_9PEZI|nr:hypothetical protein B0A48_08740 [Cryoendolithus antarcticus]
MAATRTEAIRKAIAGLRNIDELCDFEIKCGSYSFKVHKVILAAQSEYFRTVFKTGGFEEGQECSIALKAAESGSHEVDDACDNPEIIKIMVDYFYKHDYKVKNHVNATPQPAATKPTPSGLRGSAYRAHIAKVASSQKRARPSDSSDDEASNVVGSDSPKTVQPLTLASNGTKDTQLLEHAAVFATATRYQVTGLQQLAAEKFKVALTTGWNHIAMANVISFVFASTPTTAPAIRDLIVATLLCSKALAERIDVETAVSSIDSLAYTLFRKKF